MQQGEKRSTRERGGLPAGSWLPATVVLLALAWPLSLVAAAWALAHAAPGGWLYEAASIIYVAGGAVCHQRTERSFWGWHVALPVCARCTGLYAGAAAGVLGAWLTVLIGPRGRSRGPRFWRLALLAAALPTVITVLLEGGAGWEVSAWWRAAAGVPLGAAAGALVLMATAGRTAAKPGRF